MNEFRVLAKKNNDFIWVFLFPLFFLLICSIVCLIPAFPNDKSTNLNILLLILGILSGLFCLVNAFFLIVYNLKPQDQILVSINKIRIKKSNTNFVDYELKDIKEVTHKKFLKNQESVVIIRFNDSTKKELVIRYVLDADKVATYLNQIIKNEKLS